MYNPYPAAVSGVPITLGFLYLPYYTGCTLFLFYLVSAFDFIICLFLAFVQDTVLAVHRFYVSWCQPLILYSAIRCHLSVQPISGRRFGVPIALGFLYLPYYTGCTLFLFYLVSAFDFIICLFLAFVQDNILAVHYFYFTWCQPLIL